MLDIFGMPSNTTPLDLPGKQEMSEFYTCTQVEALELLKQMFMEVFVPSRFVHCTAFIAPPAAQPQAEQHPPSSRTIKWRRQLLQVAKRQSPILAWRYLDFTAWPAGGLFWRDGLERFIQVQN